LPAVAAALPGLVGMEGEDMSQSEVPSPATPLKRGFAYIAFWQFMAFLMLLLLVWANEVLDLASLIWGTTRLAPNIFRGMVLTVGVLVTAIVTVGHTYEQQRRVIKGFVTVCSHCNRVRLDQEAWEKIEEYVARHSMLTFSHGICPDCFERYVKDMKKREGVAAVGGQAGGSAPPASPDERPA